MKKIFIIFITIIGFISIENVVYAYPSTIINANTVTTLANDRFKKYFSKIFSGREDNAKMRYEILVFRNEEVEVVYDSRNKSV